MLCVQACWNYNLPPRMKKHSGFIVVPDQPQNQGRVGIEYLADVLANTRIRYGVRGVPWGKACVVLSAQPFAIAVAEEQGNCYSFSYHSSDFKIAKWRCLLRCRAALPTIPPIAAAHGHPYTCTATYPRKYTRTHMLHHRRGCYGTKHDDWHPVKVGPGLVEPVRFWISRAIVCRGFACEQPPRAR